MIGIAIKHFMYDLAIDTFFDRVSSNFPKEKVVPVIGQSYSKIVDYDINEVFLDCTIIPIEQLSYYDDIVANSVDDDEVTDLSEYAFGIRYRGYEDLDDSSSNERFDDYEETHFTKDEIDFLIFHK